jgi:NitT/TauT family transport system substrate-binding protein
VINPAFKKQYPEAVREYVTSFAAAGTFVDANRSEAIAIARKYMNIDAKVFELALSHDASYGDLRIKRNEVEQLQRFALELKLLKKPVNLDQLLDLTLLPAPAETAKK